MNSNMPSQKRTYIPNVTNLNIEHEFEKKKEEKNSDSNLITSKTREIEDVSS